MDYGCGPNSAPVAVIDRCEENEDDQDCEDETCDEDGDDESDEDGDIQADEHVLSFLTLTNLRRMSKGDISLWMCQVVMS